MFKAERCDLCGDCLAKCRWMEADKAQAVEWMNSMMAGRQTPVLRHRSHGAGGDKPAATDLMRMCIRPYVV